MASIVSAGTTSATSLNMSADTSGVLQLASNNGTVAVTVTAAQNVGIGEASPTSKLIVNSGANTTVAGFASTGSSAFLGMANSGATTFIGNDSTSGSFVVQTPGSSFATKLTVSPVGYVTTPYQPAFFAWFNNSGSNYSWANNAAPFVVVFDVATGSGPAYNTSSSYNASNGRFTAPIAGKYAFFVNLSVYTVDGVYIADCGVGMSKNGSSIVMTEQQIADTPATTSNFQNWCYSWVIDLAVNDYVQVYLNPFGTSYSNGNGNLGSGTRTNFSGYLLG